MVGLMLQIVPMPATMAHWRPQFLLLIVFYWLFRSPFQHGVTFAWLVGLLLDGFIGELFGRYAIVFALCAYLLRLLQQRLHHFGVFHQALFVLFMVLLSQLLLHSMTLLFRAGWNGNLLIAPAITSALVWPLLVWLINRLLRRMQQLG
jgi:rod shape-determining protein MreD